MRDTASDEFTRASWHWQNAQRKGGKSGEAFENIHQPRSSWPLVLIGFLAVVVGLGVMGVMS